MRSSVRWLVIVGSAIVVIVLFVLLRPEPPEDRTSPAPSTPAPTVSASASGSSSPIPSPEPERTIVEVTFRDGEVQGPTEFTVTQGDRVRIIVHADVTDEVHLHSYDLRTDVAPGDPAGIDFVANVAGIFECELEDAGTILFHLEIVP